MSYTNQIQDLEFIVSLDYSLEDFSDFECLEWGDLYDELGLYGNEPLIINGDTDFDSDGSFDHHIWNMFAGSTYSSYAMIDHNMVVKHLFDEPNYDSFINLYLPELIDEMYGCTDINALNYNPSPVYDDETCLYSDINEDGTTDINDVLSVLNIILDSSYAPYGDLNVDGNVDIFDIIIIINIILQ